MSSPSSFAALGLADFLLAGLAALDFRQPTAVQLQAIPPAAEGRDVVVRAPTGSGKTLAFSLPLLQRLSEQPNPPAPGTARALVLVPTRELAEQVGGVLARLGNTRDLHTVVAYGGVPMDQQIAGLAAGADVLVATPGRLLDLLHREALVLTKTTSVVLDEADRMLAAGFARELDAIFAALPKRRQVLLFSATWPDSVRRLAADRLQRPLTIDSSAEKSAKAAIRQWVVPVDKKRKPGLLVHLLREHGWAQVLVFVKTRAGAEQLLDFLHGKAIAAEAIHGDRDQGDRLAVLDAFRNGELRLLVATDVAARGLDIAGLPAVVNYDLPTVAEDYIHRIGRTGRAGLKGEAVSLVCADEAPLLAAIERLTRLALSRDEEPGFEPKHAVPFTSGPSAVQPKVKKALPRPSTAQAGRPRPGAPTPPRHGPARSAGGPAGGRKGGRSR